MNYFENFSSCYNCIYDVELFAFDTQLEKNQLSSLGKLHTFH